MLCCVALVYDSYIFFRTAVLRKHCNFSRDCPPVKMASKTVLYKVYFTLLALETKL